MTRAGRYLADLLEKYSRPVITPVRFFGLIRQMYQESPSKKLYLRGSDPGIDDYLKLKQLLIDTRIVRSDYDYGARALRIPTNYDRPATRLSALQTQRVIFPICLLWSDGDLRIAVPKPLCCHGRIAKQHLISCDRIAKKYWANITTLISSHFTLLNILPAFGEGAFTCT